MPAATEHATDTRADFLPRVGPLDSLRPIRTLIDRILPGDPLDPRSAAYHAVYEVVGHADAGKEMFKEDIRRIKFERIEKPKAAIKNYAAGRAGS